MHTEHQQHAATNSDEPATAAAASAANNDFDYDAELRDEIDSCQAMIEINIKNLIGLRTECDVTETLTQNNIRFLENKLVKYLSRLIVARNMFCKWKDIEELRTYPLLSQWFQMVGLDEKCKEILSEHFDDIDDLMKVNDEDLQNLILNGFSLNVDELNSLSNEDEESIDQFGNKENECIKRDIRIYVKDYITRLLKAQRCLCTCVEAMKRAHTSEGRPQDSSLSPDVELHWDSWDHRISKSDASKIAMIAAAIAEASKSSSNKTVPQPLPPLPSLRTSRLVNYRSNGDNNSKSTGSSPLSPPAPPLSAGNNSHRSTLSTSSSSSSIIPSGFYNLNNNIIVDPNHAAPLSRRPTPPPTPPVSHYKKSFIISSSSIFSNYRKPDSKFPTTPPPIRRHQANLFSSEQFPLTKSKSHEEHLSNRIEPLDPVITSKLLKKYNLGPMPGKSKNSGNKHNSLDNLPHAPHQYRRRLATEPGSIGSTSPILTSSNCSSPVAISPDNQYQNDKQPGDNCFLDNSSVVPRSPRSQGMLHSIHHRFVPTVKINFTLCNICEKQMFIGYKCRDCKYYSHRDCLDKAPNSCGLPNEFFDVFKQTLSDSQNRSSSPVVGHKNLSSASFSHRSKNYINNQVNSSHSSSNPSSPSLFNQNSSSSSTAISPTSNNSKGNSQFQFPPDINITLAKALSCDDEAGIPSDSNLLNDEDNQNNFSTIHEEEETQRSFIDSEKSNNSSLITSGSSGDSVRTLTGRFDSQDSQASDIDQNDRHWPRQNSLTSREWDIPYDELEIEEEIGTGRFGTVFRGSWHGSVAIKRINMGNNIHEDRKAMETFKQEVANFRKTRHDNLVLFMGACMKPPHLAIVTSLCKGLTLHTHIHIRHDKFNLNRTIMIAEQICLGMGYLHARGIVHKDLKTKNIFYENGKVIITDFGLSSVAKLCVTNRRGNWLTVPKGWLCYLSPEIIRALSIHSQETAHLPFSVNTDVYAFGTVWYELLCGSWPFSGQPSEVIIWQVGKGIKQMLNHFQGSKEVKELLFLCWSFTADSRPDFSKLYEHLQKLPKKRLQRSPSHPAHLQHTSEQAFF